ncbi:MAG TPA: PAS domain S-box protein [Mariprofundaceae bacterium]|nr:PAS domain S-box protein [Mariprofundaceae bacterium]
MKKRLHSPIRLIVITMVMIFIAEAFVMLLFTLAGVDITLSEGVLDATLLSVLIAPGMYFSLFRPMREQQEKLLRSQQWLKSISDHLPEALITIDENGMVNSFNPAGEKMFGYSAAEIIGKSVNILMQDEDARQHNAQIRRYLDTGESHVIGLIREVEAVRRNGEIFPIELQIRELKSQKHRYFIGMMRDISERRRQERQQQLVNERMERTQRLESLGVLAGGIAHDFNNILSSVLGNTELLRIDLGSLDADAESCLQNIETGCSHAADLCRQMLAYAGKGRYVIRAVNISDLVQGMEKLIRVSVPRSITVKKNLRDDIPMIHADVAQTEQVVLNLLTNAAEAIGDDKGEIELTTGVLELGEKDLQDFEGADGMQPGEFVFLEVTDSGCGIKPEDMKHLFEPFFTTKFTGRGLGMSAILGILRSHHGGIQIQSSLGKGTMVRVLIPAKAHAMEAAPQVETVTQAGQGRWQGSGIVLIVDDELTLRDMAGKMLKRMGFESVSVENGSKALELLAERQAAFRVVLLDLTMPGLSGAEVLVEIRRLYPGLKVIVSTGYGQHALGEHFQSCEPDGFVPKPYRYQQLMEVMLKVLG